MEFKIWFDTIVDKVNNFISGDDIETVRSNWDIVIKLLPVFKSTDTFKYIYDIILGS
jgi:hypothetical protein